MIIQTVPKTEFEKRVRAAPMFAEGGTKIRFHLEEIKGNPTDEATWKKTIYEVTLVQVTLVQVGSHRKPRPASKSRLVIQFDEKGAPGVLMNPRAHYLLAEHAFRGFRVKKSADPTDHDREEPTLNPDAAPFDSIVQSALDRVHLRKAASIVVDAIQCLAH